MKNSTDKKDIHLPTKEELDKIILQVLPEISSLRILIEKMDDNHKFSNQFIIDSIIRCSDLVLAISKLSSTNLNSVFILMRSQLEVVVDIHWFYSIYLIDKSQSDDLAKRFYQFGANDYIEMSDKYGTFIHIDPYLKTIESKLDPIKDLLKAKQKNIIEIVDPMAKSNLQRIQKMNWRALPGLINKKREIEFNQRAEIAAVVAKKISNLKDAPYYKNWKILNAFTHWSAARMNYLDEDIARVFYLRNLNIALGFLYDVMKIAYIVKGINPPPKITLLSKQFHYFST